jgi:ferritin-like metal-binding protein YciE
MAMKKDTLEELLLDSMKDLYDAEHQLVEALPKMAEAAKSPDLKKGFRDHLKQTKEQIQRLETAFNELDGGTKRKKCVGMAGLIKEGEEIMKEEMTSDVRDAGLILAAQKVEHYEIASYGTVRTYAQTLGHNRVARLFQQTLDEEAQTNEKLTALAESHINLEAA